MTENRRETEKIYETDGLTFVFDAEVLSCDARKDGLFDVVLDRTAFFPGGGGQDPDTGFIDGARVSGMRQNGGEIVHVADRAFGKGSKVTGKVDAEKRLWRMENHTGEHIFSGVVHNVFGLENVGFHLGDEYVTIDTSGPLTLADVEKAEALTNEVIRRNEKIEILFPEKDELAKMTYRSKKELEGQVRIVRIGDTDMCACCAPHLPSTGMAGYFTVLAFMPYKGGTRLYALSGSGAVKETRSRLNALKTASETLSVKPCDVPAAIDRVLAENAAREQERVALLTDLLELKITAATASTTASTAASTTAARNESGSGYRAVFCEQVDMRTLNRVGEKHKEGALFFLAVAGPAGKRKYVMKSVKIDLKKAAPAINEILGGRGGGSAGEISGSASVESEEQLFEAAERIAERFRQ
ncbi:MAG: alanyl-tRNA editing protein [Clostridia bacterium]|nr:alanyl-tRNA editing protein [Clostridia bacterium]